MTSAKKRILLVDDEPDFTRFLKAGLERTGLFETRAENQATKALAAAREFRPDLILLDVVMPDLDGAQIASEIRADPNLKDTRVVFLTGIVDQEATGGGVANIGGSLFIAKPIGLKELIKTLQAILTE